MIRSLSGRSGDAIEVKEVLDGAPEFVACAVEYLASILGEPADGVVAPSDRTICHATSGIGEAESLAEGKAGASA